MNAWVHSIKNENFWKNQLEIGSQIINIAGEDVMEKPYKEILNKLETLKKFPTKVTLIRPEDSTQIQKAGAVRIHYLFF